jgi:hypothetical protein
MNVTKENNKSIIRIVTKDKTTESKIFLILISSLNGILGLENVIRTPKYSSSKPKKHENIYKKEL